MLLEANGVLRAWRLLAEPQCGREIPAESNFDHRTVYLDYEGPVSGNRGRVLRWDWGDFGWLEDEPGRVVVSLSGSKLVGVVKLERTANNWLCSLPNDLN